MLEYLQTSVQRCIMRHDTREPTSAYPSRNPAMHLIISTSCSHIAKNEERPWQSVTKLTSRPIRRTCVASVSDGRSPMTSFQPAGKPFSNQNGGPWRSICVSLCVPYGSGPLRGPCGGVSGRGTRCPYRISEPGINNILASDVARINGVICAPPGAIVCPNTSGGALGA